MAAVVVDAVTGRVAATRLIAGEEEDSEGKEGDGASSGEGAAAVLGPPGRGCSSGVLNAPLLVGAACGGRGVVTRTNMPAEGVGGTAALGVEGGGGATGRSCGEGCGPARCGCCGGRGCGCGGSKADALSELALLKPLYKLVEKDGCCVKVLLRTASPSGRGWGGGCAGCS